MAHVAFSESGIGIPSTLYGVDFIGRRVHFVFPAHVVKDEKFVFRTEHRSIGNTGALEIGLGTLGDRTRIALVALHGRRLNDVTADGDGRIVNKRIQHRGRGFGHQNHVRFIDTLPTGDGRAVKHLAVAKQSFVDRSCGDGDVLFFATGIREAQISPLHFLVLNHLNDITGGHGRSVTSQRFKKHQFNALIMPLH